MYLQLLQHKLGIQAMTQPEVQWQLQGHSHFLCIESHAEHSERTYRCHCCQQFVLQWQSQFLEVSHMLSVALQAMAS
jgi:hypothetical protein